jgi:hypothetical protein
MIERLNAGADEPTAEMWLEDIEAQGGDGGLDPGADEGP